MDIDNQALGDFIKRHRGVWVVAGVGCLVSLAIFGLLGRQLALHHQVEFEWAARERVRSLAQQAQHLLRALEPLGDLMRHQEPSSAADFRALAEPVLRRYPDLLTLAWARPMAPSPGGGDPFRLVYREPTGGRAPATAAQDPWTGQGALLSRARDLGGTVLGGRAPASWGGGGLLVARPVYGPGQPLDSPEQRRAALRGLVVGGFRLDELVRTAVSPLEPRGIHLLILDPAAPPGERLLAFYPSRLGTPPSFTEEDIGPILATTRLGLEARVSVADRVWSVYCLATPAYRSLEAFRHGPVSTLAAGLLFTALLTLYLVRMRENMFARQRMDRRLREREALFWQMTEAIDRVLWALSPDGTRFLYLSSACERLLGIPCEPLYQDASQLRDLVPHKDWWRLRALLAGLARDQRAGDLELRLPRPDGGMRWLRVQAFPILERGRLARVVGFAEDVTARRLAEKALRKSERDLRGLFNESPDILLTVDQQARILTMSRSVPGLPAAQAVGRGSELLVPETYREGYRQALAETLATGRIGHFRYATADGTWWEIRLVPVRQAKRVRAAMVIASDVSEQQNLQNQAIRSARLASLGVLAAGVAHEINNPNNAILFSAGLLGRAWRDALPVLEAYHEQHGDFSLGGLPYLEARAILARLAADVGHNAERIKRIIESLKHLARQGDEALDQRVALDAVLREAAMLLNNEIRRHTDVFRLETAPGLPPVMGNFQQLEQVFVNLILNALQALPERRRGVCARAYADRARAQVVVEVADEGVGVDASQRHRLTEPFFTTRADVGGTGLGLSISKSILDRHGGRFEIDSEAGYGTLVTVRLPVAGAQEGAP